MYHLLSADAVADQEIRMNRGPVIHRVVLVPIQICTQQEGDKIVAVMPGWNK